MGVEFVDLVTRDSRRLPVRHVGLFETEKSLLKEAFRLPSELYAESLEKCYKFLFIDQTLSL